MITVRQKLASLRRLDPDLAHLRLEDVSSSGEVCHCGRQKVKIGDQVLCPETVVCRVIRLYLNGYKPPLYSPYLMQRLGEVQ